ncbi:MAG: tRNA preQ1(34) S-adenosylmethionine ribosyltransferase-isomerase QueA [Nitrospinota bacterium]
MAHIKGEMKLSEFNYDLPKELIAQHPAANRDDARLMILNRRTGTIEDGGIKDLCKYLGKDDLLVLNNTRVIPSHLVAHKKSGGRIDILLTKEIAPKIWEALVRQGSRVKDGIELYLDSDKGFTLKRSNNGYIADLSAIEGIREWILENGYPPLPPYIRKGLAEESDRERYQTVYAKEEGAIAAPTAGLHFTDKVFKQLKKNGTETAFITLHVGIGTFQPVREKIVNNHVMDYENYKIEEAEAAKINRAIKEGKRVVAAGTTSIRTLETAAGEDGFLEKLSGSSNLFILPGYKFKVVGGVFTNFHPPKSTPLFLVSAYAGADYIKRAYQEAIGKRYRFCSYGDAMLIL